MSHNLHRLKNALNYLADFEEKKFTEKLFAQKPQLEKENRNEFLEWDHLPTVDSIEGFQAEKSDILSLALGFIQVWFGTLLDMIARFDHLPSYLDHARG